MVGHAQAQAVVRKIAGLDLGGVSTLALEVDRRAQEGQRLAPAVVVDQLQAALKSGLRPVIEHDGPPGQRIGRPPAAAGRNPGGDRRRPLPFIDLPVSWRKYRSGRVARSMAIPV
jgi:hypothetical protein